jgi:hypothetical protein
MIGARNCLGMEAVRILELNSRDSLWKICEPMSNQSMPVERAYVHAQMVWGGGGRVGEQCMNDFKLSDYIKYHVIVPSTYFL